MLSMSQAVQRIKGATAAFIDAPLIHALGRQLELGGRQRLLTPQVTTYLFLRQILEGDPAFEGQSAAAWARGTACEETPAEGVRSHESAAGRATAYAAP